MSIDGELKDIENCVRYSGPTGLELSPFVLEKIKFKNNQLAPIYHGNMVGYVNQNGKIIRMFNHDNGPDPFHEGLARYLTFDGEKIGFVDQKLKIVIPAKFKFVSAFKNHKARYCQNCKMIKDGEHTRIETKTWKILNHP